MASNNQLRARVSDRRIEQIGSVATDRDISESEAERVLVREGLASLGYIDRPIDAEELLLYYARRIGTVLGFVGLILVGYGIFGSAAFRYMGFGLLLVGFAGIAASEMAPMLSDRIRGGDPA